MKIFVVQPVQGLLPMRHPEVDGVKVGHHEGRLEEIVETDYHRQDHVGNIDISEKLQLSNPWSLWRHGPPGGEENYEVGVVADSKELLDGGEDEDVAHDEAGAGLFGGLGCEVRDSSGEQQERGDDDLW